RALRAVDGDELDAERARDDLPPQLALGSPAGDADLADAGEARVLQQAKAVLHAEGDAFQDGTRQVRPLVAQGEADETSPSVRVGIGGPLAGEVREEEEALAARGRAHGLGHELVERRLRRQRVAVPL